MKKRYSCKKDFEMFCYVLLFIAINFTMAWMFFDAIIRYY